MYPREDYKVQTCFERWMGLEWQEGEGVLLMGSLLAVLCCSSSYMAAYPKCLP